MPDIKRAGVTSESETGEASERELLREVVQVLKRIHLALVVAGVAADIDGVGELQRIEE